MAGKDGTIRTEVDALEDGARALMSREDMFVMMKSSPTEVWEEPSPALALHLLFFQRTTWYGVVLNLS